MFPSLYVAVDKLFSLVSLIIIIRIALSWFPNVNWWQQPFKLIHDITEPVLAPFRKLIPPIGGIDLSPIVLFVVLGFLHQATLMLLGGL